MPAYAPAPSRSSAQVTLTLGLMPVPIRLFSPTETVDVIERNNYNPATGNRVNMPFVDSVTREEIPRNECVKKVTLGDQVVELSDDEIAAVTSDLGVDKGSVPVTTFVPVSEIGYRYIPKSSYQARPQVRKVGKKSLPNPVADKAFALLLETLQTAGVAALVRVGLRGAARYAALTPDGMFHFLHYDSEVRETKEMPEVSLSDTEKEMALKLFEVIGTSTPDLVDTATERLTQYLTEKANGGEVATVPVVESDDAAPEPDWAAMLAASVEATQAAK